MKKLAQKIVTLGETLPKYLYIPPVYLILLAFMLVGETFSEQFQLPPTDRSLIVMPENIWYRLLLVGVLGPLFETYFFQAMPYYFFNLFAFTKKHFWIAIVVPGICFGLLHMYSVRYMIAAFFMGLVFQSTYFVRSKKGDPFLTTYILHSLLNTVSILGTYFFL